jgi:hypothetical protein
MAPRLGNGKICYIELSFVESRPNLAGLALRRRIRCLERGREALVLSFERHSQAPDSLSNLAFMQGSVAENDAGAPGRFQIEGIHRVQTDAGPLGFAMHIGDPSAASSLQPDKYMEAGICAANFGPFAELSGNRLYQYIPSRRIRGVCAAQVTIEVALIEEVCECKLLERRGSCLSDRFGSHNRLYERFRQDQISQPQRRE